MATKKTTKNTKKVSSKGGKRAKQFVLPHIEFSKITVSTVLLLTTLFLLFVCWKMHVLGDLTPVSDIAPPLFVCVGIVVYAYMKRAYQKDMVNLEIEKTKKLSELKKKSGDDFVYERIEDVDLTV